jgi:hypothetical protein
MNMRMRLQTQLPTIAELIDDIEEGDEYGYEDNEDEKGYPEPDDYDYVVTDLGLISQGTRLLCRNPISGWDNIARFIRNHAKARNFFPSVWQFSDHGNYHLVEFNYNS